MRITVKTFINEGAGRFIQYRDDDKLVPGPVLTIVPDTDWVTDGAIGEQVWAIGNREAVDADGTEWPSDVRSMSIGDVIVIRDRAYACRLLGWGLIDSREEFRDAELVP